MEEGVACGSETLGRGTVRRGSKEQPLLLREDTGWRKLVAHRTFWHVETGWAHFGEGTWRLGSEGDILCIFRCFALFLFFFILPSICTLKKTKKQDKPGSKLMQRSGLGGGEPRCWAGQ